AHEIAKKDLDDSIIKAPIDGIVVKTFKETGEYARKGEPVLRIESPSKLVIKILPSSNYYGMIETGKTSAIINDIEGNWLANGTVTYKSPTVRADSRTFEVKIDLEENEKLVIGMLCDVELVLYEREGLGIFKEAVLPRAGNKSAIFIAKDGKATENEVKTGLISDNYIELLDFHMPDAEIIIRGQSFLNDGALINIQR
ncbi:MAG: HlyD family efflux transporter periplasmic adaptor subunit, partial [Candidatus Nanoarchaeia archaeon]